MSGFNTLFNLGSAHYNRRTAQNTAETARGVNRLASADRQRDLRDRGLITHQSTTRQIAGVEGRLDVQMRARMERRGELRRTPYRRAMVAAAMVAAVVFVLGAALLPPEAVVVWRILVLLPFLAAFAITAVRERRRVAVLASAEYGSDGRCGWCGQSGAHWVDGIDEHPRVAHAVDIEAEVGR